MASAHRHCLDCGHALVPNAGRSCPECGRTFDPDDPRTTSATPKTHVILEALRWFTVVGAWTFGILGGAAFTWLLMGGDLLVTLLLGLPFLVFVPFLLVLAVIPRNPASRRIRATAIVTSLFYAAVVAPWPPTHGWPLRLSFMLHRASMDRLVESLSSVPDADLRNRTVRSGVLDFRRVVRRRGNLGFQITGGDGGGQFLVRQGPDPDFVWINTNWEIDLGGGWWFVYQD